jgi:hypothetical protein
MENSLSTKIKGDQTNWPDMVDACLFVYRTTFNRALCLRKPAMLTDTNLNLIRFKLCFTFC